MATARFVAPDARYLLSSRIPPLRDPALFQKACVALFGAHIGDLHAQEYGRQGQAQSGIDIIVRRGDGLDRLVGVQCKCVAKPLTRAIIEREARAALKIEASLKELVFATTAPDSTRTTDDALAVEKALRQEGHDLRLAVFGWDGLLTIVAQYPKVYPFFAPSLFIVVGPSAFNESHNASVAAPLSPAATSNQVVGISEKSDASSSEDPDLHARIDVFRDLFVTHGQPVLARDQLLKLLGEVDPSMRPWARFRIETNLASVALDLGDEPEAAARFERAHSIRPDDPKALSNLAIARLIQGRHDEAMNFARAALRGVPRADAAVAYLLQAAAKSDWQGDPETLIPEDLRGSLAADVGLANFWMRRAGEGWETRCLTLARAHPEERDLKRVAANAILSLLMRDPVIGGRLPPDLAPADVERAADDMKALTDRCLAIGYKDRHDLAAYVNNAALLLRIRRRHEDLEALLKRAIPVLPDEPQLRRILAMTLAQRGRRKEAEETLRGDIDPENVLLLSEIIASDAQEALRIASSVPAENLRGELLNLRWTIVAEHALHAGDAAAFDAAVAKLREIELSDLPVRILEIRWSRRTPDGLSAARDRLVALAQDVTEETNLPLRFVLAQSLAHEDAHEEASRLLDGRLDLTRPSDIVFFYLRQVAGARRDAEFRRLLGEVSDAVRNASEVRWIVALHAWNTGDMPLALAESEAILAGSPDHAKAFKLRLEVLLRLGRPEDVARELEKPIEAMEWSHLQDKCRIAALLGHFGHTMRATAFAYRAFLENRDKPDVWLLLNSMVFLEGRLPTDRDRDLDVSEDDPQLPWKPSDVGPDVAVDIAFDDETHERIIIEPDPDLRRLDPEARETDNPQVMALLGLKKGDRFVLPDGRTGAIADVRHKFLARAHDILATFERRFPTQFGIKQVLVDFQAEGGLDGMIAQAKARHDYCEQEIERYANAEIPYPLAFLAHRLGCDVIDAAEGLASSGRPIRVAANELPEMEAASTAVIANSTRGCVMDLLALWTSWRLGTLDAVAKTCGKVGIPRSVLDGLFARRERLREGAKFGLSTMGYAGDGKLSLVEMPRERMASLLDDLDRLIAWLEANAEVYPVVIGEALSREFRDLLLVDPTDELDAAVVAQGKDLLLICDDHPTRVIFREIGGRHCAWLHAVHGEANRFGHLSDEAHARSAAHLIEAQHCDLSVTGLMLAKAAHLDATDADGAGRLFEILAGRLGGANADPRSHCLVVVECLNLIWRGPASTEWRQSRTGLLLRNLIRERHDYPILLGAILNWSNRIPALKCYVDGWLRGHFVRIETLAAVQEAQRWQGS